MDSEVIKELANQLGIAVESTGQFLEDILPQYAAMNVIGHGIWAAFFALIAALFIGLLVHVIAEDRKAQKRCNEDGTYYCLESDNMFYAAIGSVGGALSLGISAFVAVKAIQWAVTPNAMFLAMILSRVGN